MLQNNKGGDGREEKRGIKEIERGERVKMEARGSE